MSISKLTTFFAAVASLALAADPRAATFSVKTSDTKVCVNKVVTLKAWGESADSTEWSVTKGFGTLNAPTGSNVSLAVWKEGAITVHAKSGTEETDTSITAQRCPDFLNGEVVRAIVGFEHLGASGTPSDQSWLFDFFITRPALGPRVRWWGNVKVASFPQQVNTQLVTFGEQFSSTFGNLKVNQLAQNAEFVTGPELVVHAKDPFFLTLFLGGGANGPNNPNDNATVFQVPATTTPQYASFVKQFGAPPSGANYVAFLPDSSDRFLRQWQAGVRLYTARLGNANFAGTLPATVEYSIGQNEYVTSARLSGLVGHVAATYPFTFGDPGSGKSVTIYLFGEATNGYKRSTSTTPLPLAPALDSSQNPVPVTNPNAYTITVPANHRDTYRIGVGMDLLGVLNSIWGRKAPPSSGGNER